MIHSKTQGLWLPTLFSFLFAVSARTEHVVHYNDSRILVSHPSADIWNTSWDKYNATVPAGCGSTVYPNTCGGMDYLCSIYDQASLLFNGTLSPSSHIAHFGIADQLRIQKRHIDHSQLARPLERRRQRPRLPRRSALDEDQHDEPRSRALGGVHVAMAHSPLRPGFRHQDGTLSRRRAQCHHHCTC